MLQSVELRQSDEASLPPWIMRVNIWFLLFPLYVFNGSLLSNYSCKPRERGLLFFSFFFLPLSLLKATSLISVPRSDNSAKCEWPPNLTSLNTTYLVPGFHLSSPDNSFTVESLPALLWSFSFLCVCRVPPQTPPFIGSLPTVTGKRTRVLRACRSEHSHARASLHIISLAQQASSSSRDCRLLFAADGKVIWGRLRKTLLM